jgi:hypothetical protein
MSEVFVTVVAPALGAMIASLVDALTHLLRLCFLLTGRALRCVLSEKDLSLLAHEFYKDESKKVCFLSPEEDSDEPILLPLLDVWRPACALDGTPSGTLSNVSFRWRHEDCNRQHIQGLIHLQQYGTSNMYRIKYDGHFSIADNNGYASKGNRAYGTVCVPVHSDTVLIGKVFKSQKRGAKHYGIRMNFATNEDRLIFIQVFAAVGDDAAMRSAIISFQELLGTVAPCQPDIADGADSEVLATNRGSM